MKKKCVFCNKDSFMETQIALYQRTESGQPIDVYSTKNTSISTFAPFCPYHSCFAHRGIIFAVEGDIVFKGKGYADEWASLSEKELREGIKANKGDKDKYWAVQIVRAILDGRKFEKALNKTGASK